MTLDAKIISALRSADSGISGADLCRQLGVSRTAIWARIEALRELGYDIAANPHTGYRLLASPDRLLAADLQARLGKTQVIGRDIRVLDQVTSTNDVIEQMAAENANEGLVVFAESQTKGRGRLGRRWSSPSGKGLWFSILLRPNLHPMEITQLTAATATALTRAIANETGLHARIKWPNDLLLDGKKAAGILTELQAELDRVHHVIIGIGIDVQQAPSDFPAELQKSATSLKIALGRPVNRPSLATAILRELDRDYARILDRQFKELAEEWEAICGTLGQHVSIEVGTRTLRGRAEALDPNGALLLRTDHGRLEPVTGGDVLILKN
jgi:BirA family biotin operon repressor/biotin-[acetyl-CoA-carboxylase] ligase